MILDNRAMGVFVAGGAWCLKKKKDWTRGGLWVGTHNHVGRGKKWSVAGLEL